MGRPRTRLLPIEVEAKKFQEEKLAAIDKSKLDLYTAAALTGLLARGNGGVRIEDLKVEAKAIGKLMSEEPTDNRDLIEEIANRNDAALKRLADS